MRLGRESTGVYSTHSSFPHYDLFARCGRAIEINRIEWTLQTQQYYYIYMKRRNQGNQTKFLPH